MRQLDSAEYFSGLMQQVHPDRAFRDSATAMPPKSAQPDGASRSIAQSTTHWRPSISPAPMPPRATTCSASCWNSAWPAWIRTTPRAPSLKKLNDRLTEEQSMFDRNISDGSKVIDADPGRTRRPAARLHRAPQARRRRKVQITTEYPDALPVMKFANSDALRRRMWVAFNTRAYPKNREVLTKMMQTRYEIARLLGYPSWADYNAADKMIAKGAQHRRLHSELDTAARPLAEKELQMLLAREAARPIPGAENYRIMSVGYLSEQVRRAKYDFDSQSVRPYLPFMRVKQGILDTAATSST